MAHTSYRAESRKNYGTTSTGPIDTNQLKTGAMLRIADAIEIMAKRHTDLIDERDRYKRWYETAVASFSSAMRSNAALRGQITKLKKQLAIKNA